MPLELEKHTNKMFIEGRILNIIQDATRIGRTGF